MELRLDIHEFLREPGGVTLPGLSVDDRLSNVGRFDGIFCVGEGPDGDGGGNEGFWTAGVGDAFLRS